MAQEYVAGDIVPFRLNPGIVVASFFVSLIGSITTVELLHRRTHRSGWSNWIELGACSVSMGLVGIWCMHYVGNRAITLGDGSPELQLVYNPGFTAASVFIPIVTLFLAFIIADRRYQGRKYLHFFLIVSGICAGFAIAGMHYTGNLGLHNYRYQLDERYVGGAIAIACSACVAALWLIFRLQDLWMNTLVWRMVCAVLLAGAVSGMHFEAAMGTSYQLQEVMIISPGQRIINVIVATVLCVVTLPILIFFILSAAWRKKLLADRARQVTLACVRFDRCGRAMVTHEGLLLSQPVTREENQRAFEHQFDITHPAFQWIYKVSHQWPSIQNYIPQMQRHLQLINFLEKPSPEPSISDQQAERILGTADQEDYSIIFRQGFCVAANVLASAMKERLSDIGTLYDCILMTGTSKKSGLTKRQLISRLFRGVCAPECTDLEANVGEETYGRGQLLILVKQCGDQEVTRLENLGFRFAAQDKIEENLARTMQVPQTYLSKHMSKLQQFANQKPQSVPIGTVLGGFVLRAGVSKRSWEVLVRTHSPGRLPYVQLSSKPLDPIQSALLSQLHGLTLRECLLRSRDEFGATVGEEFAFIRAIKEKCKQLTDIISEPWFLDAVFSYSSIRLPTFNVKTNQLSYCNMFVFHIIPNVHGAILKQSQDVRYDPLRFFKCRQEVLPGGPHRADFEHNVHREFASLFGKKVTSSSKPESVGKHSFFETATSRLSGKLPFQSSPMSVKLSVRSLGSRSESSESMREVKDADAPFGGIMMSSEVTVEEESNEGGIEVISPVVMAQGQTGLRETDSPCSFVDELFKTTTARCHSLQKYT